MEPRIQYAQTDDGVSIAYYTLGQGLPLVVMPNVPMTHVELEWRIPQYRSWYESLLADRQLVRYDNRGSGLSDRHADDYSLEGQVRDLEAITDRLGQQSVALLAPLIAGPIAIAFAARHPERVSHLVLWCSYARASDYGASPAVQTITALREHDWNIYTEAVAHTALGWEAGEPARQFAALMRECVDRDTALALFDAMKEVDVTDLLPQLQAATLVLHRRQIAFPDVEMSRALAARIPGARLAVLDGNSLAPFLGDSQSVADAIHEFLREEQEPLAAAEPVPPGGVHTILFTDVEGSTALTQRLGDAKARELLRAHERIVRDALKAHGGSEVKALGDGFMASFSSAARAIECSIAMQRAFAHRNQSAEEPVNVRIGLNAGEPIAEEEDLFGASVNRAARIAAAAQGGQILVANVVRELAEGKSFMFGDRGEAALRGFDDPVRLFEVRWREEG